MSLYDAPLLEVSGVRVDYGTGLPVIDDVSFSVAKGETLGVVGESGSGKTTIARALLGLAPVASGSILFEGKEIAHATPAERTRLSKDLQVVFQDPWGSLNPRKTIGQILAEPLLVHEKLSRPAMRERIEIELRRVGLPGAAADKYPVHFSGGERQRIAIARALMPSPQLIVCDEALSALDLSIQAQIVNLLTRLKSELDLSLLFIGHDLSVVRLLSDRVVVLYGGQIMEVGDSTAVCSKPRHLYTQALFAATPVPDPRAQAERRAKRHFHGVKSGQVIRGQGCPFQTRCPLAIDICLSARPPLVDVAGVEIACHRAGEAAMIGRETFGDRSIIQ